MAEIGSDGWAREGPDDDMARRPTVPAFLELADGGYKPLADCSADEIRAAADSMLMKAKLLAEEAERLFEIADGTSTT